MSPFLPFLQCERRPLDVIFLVDVNDFNNTMDFNKQQSRINDAIRYLANISIERNISYGVIEFHQSPVILLPITSTFASQYGKVVDYTKTLESHNKFGSSPARALELAAQQFIDTGRVNSNKLVILAHNGVSMDLIAETLEARNRLKLIGAKLFAITSITRPNLPALIGYTTNRQYVYATESDRNVFYEEIKRAADQCSHVSESFDENIDAEATTSQTAIEFGIRTYEAKETQLKDKLKRVCKANKVDLMIVLDSSSSVFNAFEDERKLVHDLIDSLLPAAMEDGRIQVSMVHFASSAEVVIPSKIGQTPDEIMAKLDKIQFIGGGTRIANAVDIALADLSRWRRNDAIQIFILISDGNGQEFWHAAQITGKKLQSANVEVFAVPISQDYDLNELTLYTGDTRRIYVGAEQNRFVNTISSLINKCVQEKLSQDIRSLTNNKQSMKLEKNQKSKLIINETIEKRQIEEDITAKISPQIDYFDLLFVIDLSPDLFIDLKNQLKLMKEFINKVTDKDINEGRIRIAVVTFTEEARLNLEWGRATTKAQILQHFNSIKYITSNNSSAVTGITFATQYAQKFRRPNARLIIILVSDGSTQDLQHSIMQAAKKLDELQETIVYAITTSKQYKFNILEAFTKDRWKIYVDGRTGRFVTDASNELLKKETNENDKSIDIIFSPIIESIQIHNDPVDFIILMDKSTAKDDDFEASKRFLEELIRSLQIIDSDSRIRMSLITFTDIAHIEIDLRKSATKEDVLYAVEKLQNEHSNASVSEAVNIALRQVRVPGEEPRKRIFVILTDGSIQDSVQTAAITAAKLHQIGAEVYIIPITDNYLMDELLLYAGDQSKFITNIKRYKKKFANYVLLDDSSSVKEDFVVEAKTDQSFGKEVETFFHDQSHVASKPVLTVKSITENETFLDFDRPSTEINLKDQNEDPNCLVDLIFIMDTSQSVENTFQKQLHFATTLIKQIPPSAFDYRIRVAAVSFSSQAMINFQFNEFNNQTEILNALRSLTHTGGNTSSVSGINLAIKEIYKRGREGVRRMVVLISDGHSQDRWEDILDAADRLRATNAIVYAISANHDYYFRELELYTASKWLVYANAREEQFMDDATVSLLKCQNPSAPIASLPSEAELATVLSNSEKKKLIGEKELIRRESSATSMSELPCKDDYVDLLFIIDTSASIETYFNSQKALAMDLIGMIPPEDFSNRLAVAMVKFSDTGKVHFGFEKKQTPEDILYELERLEQTGSGTSSLVAGVQAALLEIASNRRSSARLVIVIFSNGNNQDIQQLTQSTALNLRKADGEIYAMAPYETDELTEYTGSVAHVYYGDRVDNFTEDISNVILNCKRTTENHAFVEGIDRNSLIERILQEEIKQKNSSDEKKENHLDGRQEFITPNNSDNSTLATDEEFVEQTRIVKSLESKICKYSKMDLEIILDASTSRQQVFEHQRELALSLIERLPIDADKTHVAVGINSFTSIPTLRQTLGLGRDKQMVRHAIEDIKYNGGSTFTAQAVELSVQDLKRGRRPDAIQVVVLMNDGMSQDPWEKVIEASQLLKATGAELFGVALGENIDLRELKHYIGNTDRIYRDNSTESFLTDVVSLLTDEKECNIPAAASLENAKTSSSNFNNQICSTPNLDIIILFDNAIKRDNLSEQSISSNRYLLLDVLGSLPVTKHSGRVTITVITFNSEPELVISMDDLKNRDSIFTKVESIRPKTSKSSYAKAINFAIQEYNKGYREDARGMLVIVGDGRSDDNADELNNAVDHLRTAKSLSKYAVDSGKLMDVDTLSKYTGSSNNIFNYDRNAEFAKLILDAADVANKARCTRMSPHIAPFSTVTSATTIRSTSASSKRGEQRRKDILSKVKSNLKQLENEKTISEKETTTTVINTRTSRPTIKAINKEITKQQFALSKGEKKNGTLLDGKNLKEEQLKGTSKSSRSRTTQTIPNSTFHRQLKNTTLAPQTTTIFTPGCEIDAIMLIDSSGSVEKIFNREKELAAELINRLRIGPDNARIAIIKFAAKEKVKTIWSFNKPQEKQKVLQALQEIPFSSGTTAIHAALLQAIAEYSSTKGARPQQATPFVIIFTDGFGQKDTTEAATSLRNLIPNIFAVTVSSQHPASEEELIKIAGSKDRVFMDSDVKKLFEMLEKIIRRC
ncbi:unnamed protein product [Cercopithifilaria johnstoni]|uniref:VWFA domain-containing protein n=1 Tax=Cercopithifilaria johnstoni TaxID=2874296 RepID=A0A8J2MMA2_9BILA|nr:unnamed protein product [Cercopithifilaria johnstoni]